MVLVVTVFGSSASLNPITIVPLGSTAIAPSFGVTERTVGGGLPGRQAPFRSQISSPSFGSPFEQSAGPWQPVSTIPPAPAAPAGAPALAIGASPPDAEEGAPPDAAKGAPPDEV